MLLPPCLQNPDNIPTFAENKNVCKTHSTSVSPPCRDIPTPPTARRTPDASAVWNATIPPSCGWSMHGEIRRKDVRDVEPDNNRGLRLVPQLIASDAEKGERILSLFSDKGWQEADVNLGCPFPMLAKRHNGAGMLPYPDEVEQLLTTLCEKFPQIRLSVKLRLGWERPDECLTLLPLLNRLPLADIIMHPRLGKQQYKGMVDMEGFRTFYESCEKPLFYNGDLLTTDDIDRIRQEFPRLAGAPPGVSAAGRRSHRPRTIGQSGTGTGIYAGEVPDGR